MVAHYRSGRYAVAAIVLGFVVAFPVSPLPGGHGIVTTGPRSPAGGGGVGGGPVGFSDVQSVGAVAYWDTFCPSTSPGTGCVVPGGLAYDPTANLVVLAEEQVPGSPVPTGPDALQEFDPTTLGETPAVDIGCLPMVPFYPGTGGDVFVPCQNGSADSILVFNAVLQTVVSRVPVPFDIAAMAYDPTAGYVDVLGKAATGPSGTLLGLVDPSDSALVRVTPLSSQVATGGHPSGEYAMVFDASTDRLIVPSSSNGLVAIDPTSGGVVAALPLPSSPVALAVDPATNELFASSADPSSVTVFNASTYRVESTIPLPDRVAADCVYPNDANQLLIDPTHGDAYLVSTDALFALNLSTLAIVAAVEDYGDGPQLSSAYVPAADRIFGTYVPTGSPGPGFMLQLDHGSCTVVSSLLWLPTAIGTLVVGALCGAALIGVHRRVARRSARPLRDGRGDPTPVRTGVEGTEAPGSDRASDPER